MKIAYQNVIWLLYFAAYNYMSLADDPPLVMAGFFEEENFQANIAFQTAISNFNSMNHNVTFKTKSYIISESDSFESSRLLCNWTQTKNVGGVICPTSPKIAPIIESICTNLEIPAIQINWRPFQIFTDNSLVINMFPQPKMIFHGLGVIARHLQWRSIVIFYENAENLIMLQDILKIQNSGAIFNSIIVKELGPGPDYRSALKQLQGKSEHHIILDCKTENFIPVMRQAKELKLLEKQFSYFLTSLDAHTLDFSILDTTANITTVRIIDPESEYFKDAVNRWQLHINTNHLRIVDLDPYSIKTETALLYDAVNLYTGSVRELHGSGTKIVPENLSCQDNIKAWQFGLGISSFMLRHSSESEILKSAITGPMKFDTFGRRQDFNLYVVAGNREQVEAIWTPESPDSLQFLKSEDDRNKALEEKWTQGTVIVASIKGLPYLQERTPPPDADPYVGNARYEGFSMDLMKELSKILKIQFEFNVFDDGRRGNYVPENKSWNGLIREILDGRAELAICDLTITSERREVVDFSAPFMRLGISILYKKPEPKEADMYAFFYPLSFNLWMYSATIYLALSVVLFFITRVSPRDWENPHPCDPEPEELENIWNIKNCLWLTLGSIMNQGCDILPKGLASRMTASMWWFFTIIVTNSYMANLAAFLTNERNQGSINSAEDLAKQTKVKYGTMIGGSTETFFKNSNYTTYQRMWTNMLQSRPSVFEETNDLGVARVQSAKNRGYAFLMESATLEYQVFRKCNLTEVGTWLDSKSYGIAMPLNYPHRSRINAALLELHESGKIRELKELWWEKKKGNQTDCPTETDTGPSNKLALQNVGGVFVVLGVGIALSYIVAISEFLWNARNVSVAEHISFLQALKVELWFALNVSVTKKRVKPQVSKSSSDNGETKSMAHSILQGAGSFLRLDMLSKTGTPGSSRHSSRPLD